MCPTNEKMKRCTYDPMLFKGKPIGMFHCPECGEMVIAGLSHYPESVDKQKLDTIKDTGGSDVVVVFDTYGRLQLHEKGVVMSADNIIYVQQQSNGKWCVWMDFASNDVPSPSFSNSFDSRKAAFRFASDWYCKEAIVEYGIIELDTLYKQKECSLLDRWMS